MLPAVPRPLVQKLSERYIAGPELKDARDTVGVVLQAMLRRTDDDIAALADLKPSIRLCKGIYIEPPDLAYQDLDEVRASYVRALDALLACGSYVGIATHDEWLLDEGRRLLAERGLSRN